MLQHGENNLKLLKNDLDILSKLTTGIIDSGFMPLCRIFNSVFYNYAVPEFEEREITPFKYEHNDTAIVLFSGGKVSLAVALRLRDMHKNVVLLHFTGNNAEKEAQIECLMRELKLPYIISDKLPHSKSVIMKGILMIQVAMETAFKEGYSPVVYTGMFDYASIYNNNQKDWKYCNEVISVYTNILKRYIDGAKVLNIMPNYNVAEDEILKHKRIKEFIQ